MTNVEVYGVPRTTNIARVMIEADYRMKLIAVGVEPPPIRMTTFVGALKGAPRDMQAWWLTPEYKCVKQTNDGLSVQLIGRGVALKTENILFGQQAQVVQTKLKPSRAARSYANSFTKLYEQISQRRPVFVQLRNAIDLLVLTAWVAKNDGYQESGWQPDLLFDEASLRTTELADIKHAPFGRQRGLERQPAGIACWWRRFDPGFRSFEGRQHGVDDKQEIQLVLDAIKIPNDDRWWWD